MYKICEIELGLGYLADKKYNYIRFFSENDNLVRLGKVRGLLMYTPEYDTFIEQTVSII